MNIGRGGRILDVGLESTVGEDWLMSLAFYVLECLFDIDLRVLFDCRISRLALFPFSNAAM